MQISRRHFLAGAAVSISHAAPNRQISHVRAMAAPPKLLDLSRIAPFVDALPRPPVAKPVGYESSESDGMARIPLYRLSMSEITAKIHRDVPATRFWSYGNSFPGPTIEVRSGEEILVDWPNQLPTKHFLPVDHNLMGAEKDRPEVRAVVHLHGARVDPENDGYPEDWWTSGQSKRYRYTNKQDAAMLWYHDHAMGITRLNICAGMFGAYFVRDSFEDGLNLPKGEFEVPLIISDRLIDANGQLYYPSSPIPDAPWVPEFFGDAILINGKLLPYLEVKPRRYRFRLLNGSNGKFFYLTLSNNQDFYHVGSDQGLLPAPAAARQLTVAPGERLDLVIDFADSAGAELLLKNQTTPIMKFRVAREKVLDPSSLPKTLRPVARMDRDGAVGVRQLPIDEMDDKMGDTMVHLLDGKRWHDPVSEKPVLNSTEIWEFVNLTDDTHPIHLHMVRFQVLERRAIRPSAFVMRRELSYLGDAFPPEPHEVGWKDTVRATPGAVTRIIARFEGFTGRYVWHCHVLEHEDNEMMRPYEVVAG